MVAKISAIEYSLPELWVTNEDLEVGHPEWVLSRVAERTGVFGRYFCQNDETALDLSVAASEKLFKHNAINREDISALIVCTQSPDYLMPSNSALLQHALHLPSSVMAFDFNLACSGFIYGMYIAKALIESNLAKTVLLVTAETYSKYLSKNDRSTMALFGDGAAATLLTSGDKGLGEFVLGTDGSGGDCFMIPAGGARIPKTQETSEQFIDRFGNSRSQEHIYMDGSAMLRFVRDRVPECVNTLLYNNGLSKDDISMFIFHQASGLALDLLGKTLEIPEEKLWRNLSNIGNTVSASIPIAVKDADMAGSIPPGSKVMLAGFGVGFSWGACIVDW